MSASSTSTDGEASPAGGRRVSRWYALGIFLLALVFRLAYLQEARVLPDFERPLVDAGYHDYWAWGLASGEWEPPLGMPDPELRTTPWFRPPLVPLWMAGAFSLFGHDHYAARLAQILVGALGCVLTLRLAARLFGRGAGLAAGILAAVDWMLVYFDTEYREVFLLVVLYQALLLGLLAWRDRPGVGRALGTGLVLGLAVLAKPNGLVIAPFLVGWMVFVTRGRLAPRRALGHGLALALAMLACVVPATVRNWRASGEFVLISSNGGINLFIGNNPTTNGTQVSLPPTIPPFDSAYDYPEIVRSISEREGRELSHAEASSWFTARALEHVKDAPLRTLALMGRKLAAFFGATEIVSEKDLLRSRRESVVLRLVPLDFAAIFAAALVGLWLALRAGFGSSPASLGAAPAAKRATNARERRNEDRDEDDFDDDSVDGAEPAIDLQGVALVCLFVALFALSFLPFFVTARYRAPILPLLIVFAGHALARFVVALRARRFGVAGALLVVGAGLRWLDHYPIEGYVYDPGKAVAERGALLAVEGRGEEAEAAFREAVRLSPDNAHAHGNLGLFLQQSGRTAEAFEHLERALQLDSRDYRNHQNLALALLDSQRVQEALAHFEQAGRLQPTNADLPTQAGDALRARGQFGPAKAFLERALSIDAGSVQALTSLGMLYLSARQSAQAVAPLQRAAELAPANANVFNLLGAALAQSGRREEARAAFETAVRLAPDNPRMRENLERLR